MEKDSTGSFYYYLSEGCRLCYKGTKMVLFVTGICGKNCFYCPVSEERKEKDVVFANEKRVEKDDDVIEKVKNLLEHSITPVLCVSNLDQLDSYIERGQMIIQEAEKIIFVYEPPSAISGGGDYHPESPKVANENAKKIIQKIGKDVTLLYGGSINPENISEFFSQEKINGGLVGQASTNPTTFLKLISNI